MVAFFIGWAILMMLGVPISYSLLLATSSYLLLTGDVLLGIPQRMMAAPNSFPILAIPFFILAGQIMNSAGITDRIYSFGKAILGHVRGSLGHVNVLASIIFAGMSGSGAADVAGLGTIELDAQRKAGFDDDFNVGVTLSSAVIGPIIPPSIPMVMYGSLASTSVGALFLGGVIPGLLMGVSLFFMVYLFSRKRNYPIYKKANFREKLVATRKAFWALLTPLIILSGIAFGIVTPTEAAIVTVVYALALGMAVYREFKIADLMKILLDTVETTGTVVMLIAAAGLFGWTLSRAQIPQTLARALISLTDSPLLILLLMNVFLLIVGCFIEGLAALVVLVPIIMPILQSVGINPVHFGVVMVLNITIGAITPPVGTYLYIMTKVADMSFENVVKGVLPWIVPLLIVLLVITLLPGTVLWLPGLFNL
ncbi:MAG: TRAP transporter large permease [Spirochaetales bacterium]|jgi:tripartite ATP-independent transporter DctM subunit|nr:TRAP transporter large permease [Spirochaetales bacterium]